MYTLLNHNGFHHTTKQQLISNSIFTPSPKHVLKLPVKQNYYSWDQCHSKVFSTSINDLWYYSPSQRLFYLSDGALHPCNDFKGMKEPILIATDLFSFWMNARMPPFSRSLVSALQTTLFGSERRMSGGEQSIPPMAIMNTLSCRLVSPMPLPFFKSSSTLSLRHAKPMLLFFYLDDPLISSSSAHEYAHHLYHGITSFGTSWRIQFLC